MIRLDGGRGATPPVNPACSFCPCRKRFSKLLSGGTLLDAEVLCNALTLVSLFAVILRGLDVG